MNAGSRQAIVVAVIAGALAAPAAAAADTARVEYSDTFDDHTPGVASGRTFVTDFFAADDANGKPPPLAHARYVLPEGARFNTKAVTQCTATDAQVMAQGADACPPDSRVGGGVIVVDTGLPEPNRMLVSDITGLNAPDAAIILAQDRNTGGRLVIRATVGERTFDIDVPPLPGAPPDGGANRHEEIHYDPVTGPGGAFLTTPPDCPAEGWVIRSTWTFRNGEKQTRESSTPCDAASAAGDAQRITFFRRQHAWQRREGTLRLRARRNKAATVDIARGGQTLRTVRAQLRAGLNRVALPALPAGRYRLTVTTAGVRRRAVLVVRR